MPLRPGKGAIGQNIKELAINSKTGKPRPMKQRVAIALDEARRTGADIPPRPKRRSYSTVRQGTGTPGGGL